MEILFFCHNFFFAKHFCLEHINDLRNNFNQKTMNFIQIWTQLIIEKQFSRLFDKNMLFFICLHAKHSIVGTCIFIEQNILH